MFSQIQLKIEKITAKKNFTLPVEDPGKTRILLKTWSQKKFHLYTTKGNSCDVKKHDCEAIRNPFTTKDLA